MRSLRQATLTSFLLLALVIPAVASPAAGSTPRLTDSFAMKMTVTRSTNWSRKGTHVRGLDWLFAPRCDTGACSVEVSTTPGACPSGQCPQWPGGYIWADEPLTFSKGTWRGSFTVKQACYTANMSSPYAYSQRTIVQLHVTSARSYGPGQSQARTIAGTMTFAGKADPADARAGCTPYAAAFTFTGASIA